MLFRLDERHSPHPCRIHPTIDDCHRYLCQGARDTASRLDPSARLLPHEPSRRNLRCIDPEFFVQNLPLVLVCGLPSIVAPSKRQLHGNAPHAACRSAQFTHLLTVSSTALIPAWLACTSNHSRCSLPQAAHCRLTCCSASSKWINISTRFTH